MSFDRTEHCRRIGAHGGAVTVARHGVQHMRMIGTAGFDGCASKHGTAQCLALIRGKGWHGRKPEQLRLDLAAGAFFAYAAKES